MATGRIREIDRRVYMDGYDLSGYIRKTGDLKWEFASQPDAAFTDVVKAITAVGQASLGIGTLNGFFDNTVTLGLHIVAKGAGVKRVILIAQGIRAAPAMGDPVYCGEFEQTGYQAQVDNTNVVASIPFGDADAVAAAINYTKPWGVLLHAKGAETGANSGTGVDGGGQTTKGGYMVYQIFSVVDTGTVTLSVQDADTNVNGSFAALSPPLTSGAIADTSVPCAGVVAILPTATVKQFARFQIALSGITSCTFALAFVRG